ncbi:tetratricopeptide repeat protein [Nocardia vaccinii]|uniref:tetratricopeptide repeat protein n=1 Tax=Nocardia vaccinii TaxID=1822 RepID=UPI00082DF01D|nr:tetratricopeptide repeat protein [Nocardia vaccinii]
MTTREEHERAAAAGNIDAMHDFGQYLERSTPPDIPAALDWYGRAAAGGHRCAMNDLGRLAEGADPPDLRSAREWYERGAIAGDATAMYNMAGLLADRTTPADPAGARPWYERAAAAQYKDAYFKLAYLLAERLDPPDPAAARKWYEKAAEHGDSVAMYNIGQLYRYTLEPKDPVAARHWYERAAGGGYTNAAFTLGLMSEADNDIPDAILWYEKAAADGHAGAMNNLGTVLEAKVHTPNLPAATEWYERAAVAGNTNAKTNLTRLRGAADAAPERPSVERTVLPDRAVRATGAARPKSTTDSSGVAAALDALIEDTPYRHNPFRIAGLHTDADSRQVRKRITELEAAEKLGAPLARTTALPVSPPPDAADVKAALNRLREPVNRLVQELFWLWPCTDDDTALAALSRDDTATAEGVWLDRMDQDAIAAHNIAVLRHIQGLETPRGQAPETWLDALTAWGSAMGAETMWNRLRERASRIDDRRLDSAAVAELRGALPAMLLRIQAALIVNATANDDFAAADLHIAVLDRFAEQVTSHPGAFDTGAIDDARGWAIRKLAARLKTIADEAHRAGSQRPAEAAQAVQRMLDRARVPLLVIDRLRPPSDPLGAGAHDDIVGTAIFCDIQHYNEVRDIASSVAMLERLGPIATTTAIRDRLRKEWSATATLQVDKLCAEARAGTEANKKQGLQAARDLLDRTRLPLARIRASDDPGGERIARAQDHIATTATSCAVSYCNETGDMESTEQVLRRIQPLPVGAETRAFVQEQIAVLAGMLRERDEAARLRNTCWFCEDRPAAHGRHYPFGLHRDVTYSGNTKRWRTLTVEVPRCDRCRQLHLPEESKRNKLGGAVALGVLGAIFSFFIGLAAHPVFIVTGICVFVALVAGVGVLSMGSDEIKNRALTYPPVTELLGQGWRRGERPA